LRAARAAAASAPPLAPPLRAGTGRKTQTMSGRTVGALRPKAGLALDPDETVTSAARKMASANVDAGLVVTTEGALCGILTDTDVTRKVLCVGLDPDAVLVSECMTANPQCVSDSENAVDALCTMVERRFRHLPVLDGNGAVVGVLDIMKCLYDAISRLEKHLSSASSALSNAVLSSVPLGGVSGSASAQEMVDGMVQKLFSPSLSELLDGPVDGARGD
jgi:CBS domain-containing protein